MRAEVWPSLVDHNVVHKRAPYEEPPRLLGLVLALFLLANLLRWRFLWRSLCRFPTGEGHIARVARPRHHLRPRFEVQLDAEEDLRLGVICEPLDGPLFAHLDVVVVLPTLQVRGRSCHLPAGPHFVAPLEAPIACKGQPGCPQKHQSCSP